MLDNMECLLLFFSKNIQKYMKVKYILSLITLGLAVVNAGVREPLFFGSETSVVPSVIAATSTAARGLPSKKNGKTQRDLYDAAPVSDDDDDAGIQGGSKKKVSALEGTFYDMKQIGKGSNRRVSKLARREKGGRLSYDRHAYYQVIANFVQKGWKRSTLKRYYEADAKQYASYFYQPMADARYGPIAFQLGDSDTPEFRWICQPGGWAVVYRGRVRAPKTGKFRFIGQGDEYIGVRFNKKLVLSAGYCFFTHYDAVARGGEKFWFSSSKTMRDEFLIDVESGVDRLHKGYEIISTVAIQQYSRFSSGRDYEPDRIGTDVWTKGLGGLMAGTAFNVKEGEVYDIEIIIADAGGSFGYVLCIEDITEGKNSRAKQYDLFRTDYSAPSADAINERLKEVDCECRPSQSSMQIQMDIPFNEDSPVWTVVPNE